MYFSHYKKKNKNYRTRNRLNNKRGFLGTIIRFVKLAIIISSIVPAIYLLDRAYKFIGDSASLDSYLKVSSTRITGNNFVREDELASLLAGVKGLNIINVEIEDIAYRMKGHPWIKDVSIRRELPGAIVVDVLERTPSVNIEDNGSFYLADEEGILLENRKEGLLSLPVVYGIPLTGVKIGEKCPAEGLLSAIEVKQELMNIPWIDLSYTGIEVDKKARIVLHLKGYRIKLGRGGYSEKLKRFYKIAENLKQKGVSYKEVDLRFDNQVVVKTLGT